MGPEFCQEENSETTVRLIKRKGLENGHDKIPGKRELVTPILSLPRPRLRRRKGPGPPEAKMEKSVR